MAPIHNETFITPENVSNLTNKEIGVVLEESKRRLSETATTLENKETLSKAPRWTGKIYSDPTAPTDDKIGRQSTLNREYKGTTYTYVRLDGIEQAFQKQGIEVKDFNDQEEATLYLKEIFKDFATKFPALQKENNWFNIDNTIMYHTLLGPNGALKNIPYTSYQDSTGDWGQSVDGSCLCWLPLRVKGLFVFFGSYRNDQEARFYLGGEGDAVLIPSLED